MHRFQQMHRLVRPLVLAAALASCGGSVVTTTSATILRPGVVETYSVPPDAPRGNVEISSYGVTSGVLHLRAVLSNISDSSSWTFDVRDQLVATGGSARLTAPEVTGPAVITVPPAGRRVVDLYFPLPAARSLPAIDAIWTVHTANRKITERTEVSRPVVRTPPAGSPESGGSGELLEGNDSYRFPW